VMASGRSDASDPIAEMEQLFTGYSKILEVQSSKREEIAKSIREISRQVRNIQFTLQKVQTLAGDMKEMNLLCDKALEQMNKLSALWQAVHTLVGDESYEKFRDHWRQHHQSLAFCVALAFFLRHSVLVSIAQTNETLGMTDSKNKETVLLGGIDLEDYLNGVSLVPKELSRLCINCVRASNYDLPRRIAAFVNDLYGGFRLLNLRNDTLRRKFDGVKYDIQKIEEVLYDIEVRKLTPAPSGGETSSSAPPATVAKPLSSAPKR